MHKRHLIFVGLFLTIPNLSHAMINLSFELDSMETAMPTSKLKAQGEATRPVRKKETPEQYKERRQRMAQKHEARRR